MNKPAEAKQRELRTVEIASIWINPSTRLRDMEDLDDESVEPLAKSLKLVKQIEPVIVTEEKEPQCAMCASVKLAGQSGPICEHARPYRLYVGERRLAAAKLAGQTTIEAIIDNSLLTDEARAEDVPFHENVERVNHSVWQFYREVIRRRERHPDESIAALSERTDLSVAFIEDCERIHECVAPDIIAKLKADARSETFRHLSQAARIEGATLTDRHKAQREWWAAEGWRRPMKPGKVARKGRPSGSGGARRPSAKEVERMARRIEDDRVVEAGGERAELGARAAKIVAALIRRVAGPSKQTATTTDTSADGDAVSGRLDS